MRREIFLLGLLVVFANQLVSANNSEKQQGVDRGALRESIQEMRTIAIRMEKSAITFAQVCDPEPNLESKLFDECLEARTKLQSQARQYTAAFENVTAIRKKVCPPDGICM